ncbi:DUF721 domain-containing protein [Thermaurantiacus tibetensis]|uniref:DUF721 domain-containing protein n=1 Tax=Thermaurantiacus tibetensis TaxID=2759035 RepID=UPI00188F59F3|nr:DUF721 domain-containing protein [Thermaurantiacus tibetensis]
MARRPPAEPEPAPRRGRPKAIGELISGAGARAFRRFGFAEGQLVARWREIVGPVYARWSAPESLRAQRGKGSGEGATLVVRVEGPFALQLQHAAPVILERCNRLLGGSVVGRLRLVQGRIARAAPAGEAEEHGQEESPDSAGPAPPSLRSIADPDLRAALDALARAVATTSGPPRVR